MPADSASGTEGEASKDTDDGDNGEELDQGERIRRTVFVLVE